MGMIKVELSGSFTPERTVASRHREFSAMEHGHAAAVAEVIAWLSSEVLPKAIAQDHALHDDGHRPDGPFGMDAKPGDSALGGSS